MAALPVERTLATTFRAQAALLAILAQHYASGKQPSKVDVDALTKLNEGLVIARCTKDALTVPFKIGQILLNAAGDKVIVESIQSLDEGVGMGVATIIFPKSLHYYNYDGKTWVDNLSKMQETFKIWDSASPKPLDGMTLGTKLRVKGRLETITALRKLCCGGYRIVTRGSGPKASDGGYSWDNNKPGWFRDFITPVTIAILP